MKNTKKKSTGQSRPSLAERTFQTVLENGLSVFICPRPGSGTVFAQTVVRTGSVHEGEDLGCGLSHFLEHMVFSGTEKYPGSTQIADKVNSLGGILNASTGYNSTQYYMEVPAADAPDAIDMLGEMLTAPLFPEERFLHEKNVILRESAMRKDDPYSHLFESLLRLMFPGHPAGIPIIGCPEKIAQVNRAQMAAYYERRYAPCRTAFVVSGDIDPEKALALIAAKTGNWRAGRMDEVILPQVKAQNSARFREIRYNTPAAWLAMGFHQPDRNSPDHAVLDVLSNVLAGTDSARLIRKLKTQTALADEVSARRLFLPASSLDLIMAIAAPEKITAVRDAIRTELANLTRKPAEKAELARIVTGIERAFWDVLAGNKGLGGVVSGVFASGGSLVDLDAYPDKIRAVTPEALQAAAGKYYAPALENLVIQLPETNKRSLFPVPEKMKAGKPVLKKLPAGQRTVCIENSARPLVFFHFCFPGGTLAEPLDLPGVSDLTAELLACGTKKFSEEKFNCLIDDAAMTLSTNSESDHISVEASCMVQHVPQMVKLLKSMFSEPLFAEKTFQRERDILYRQIAEDAADPAYRAKLLARETLYGRKHPYGVPGKTVLASIKKLTREDVLDFYGKMFDPALTVSGISGACPEKEAAAILKDIFSVIPWKKQAASPYPGTDFPQNRSGCKCVSEVIRKAQSVVLYALPACSMKDFSLASALVLQASNGMASRLFKTVREERGLAYYTSLRPHITGSTGWICYLAGTKPGAEKQVLELFEEERQLRLKNGFTEEEFSAAAARLRFELVSRLQKPEELLSAAVSHEFRGAGAMRTLENLKALDTVTLDDMNQAAERLFSRPFRVMAAAAPEKFSDFPESCD